jgi:hypothetical protein
MPFITASGFIAAATAFTIAVIVGTLAFSMQARGQQQRRRIERHQWGSETLHVQAERAAQLNVDGGKALLRTAGGIFAWSVIALFLPYDRVPGLLPIATLGPALAIGIVAGRVAARYRAFLRR